MSRWRPDIEHASTYWLRIVENSSLLTATTLKHFDVLGFCYGRKYSHVGVNGNPGLQAGLSAKRLWLKAQPRQRSIPSFMAHLHVLLFSTVRINSLIVHC